MKKVFLPLILVVTSALLFMQCKKDSSSSAATVNFSPLTIASSWTYSYTTGSAATQSFTSTVTSRDTTINSKTYSVLSNSDGTFTYLCKSGNNYYRFASFPGLGLNNFEELYLIDTKAVNETWSAATSITYSGFTLPVNLNYTIKEKGISRTVSGKSFTSVTHVRLDISLSGSAVGGGDFYYQDGVGLIEDSILVTPPLQPAYTSTELLTAYQIK